MLLFRANHIHHLQHIPPNLKPHVVGSELHSVHVSRLLLVRRTGILFQHPD